MNKYLEKYGKERNKNLKYDFLPSMLGIIERPANKLATVCLLLIVASIATMVIWATVSKLDIAVTAVGTVAPQGDLIALNAGYTARVSEINVKEGDYVNKGDKILTFEKTEVELSKKEAEYSLKILKVKQQWYNNIYNKLKGQNVNVDIDTSKYGFYAKIIEEIILEYQVYEKNYNTLKSTIEKVNYEKQFRLSVLENINKITTEIYTLNSNIKKLDNQLTKMDITSPVSGKVTQLAVKNKEKLVNASDVVGYIIPKDKENIFNAYVTDKDIREIKKDKKVGIKIEAYDDTKDEYIEGTVTYVGDVAMTVEGMGSMYLVQIKIEDMPEDIKVGMEGNCNIIVGKRTVLDYFLEPFKEGFRESLKER